jgi:hypothetical protein
MSNGVWPYFPVLNTKTHSGSDVDIFVYLYFTNCYLAMNNVQEEMLLRADRKRMQDYFNWSVYVSFMGHTYYQHKIVFVKLCYPIRLSKHSNLRLM